MILLLALTGCSSDKGVKYTEKDVMDAISIGYFYRTGNLIISTDDTSVGLDPEFGDALDEFYDRLRNHPDEFYAQFKDSHDSIQQT